MSIFYTTVTKHIRGISMGGLLCYFGIIVKKTGFAAGMMLVLLLPALAQAQSGVVTGQVVDENELPLPGANILLKGINRGKAADANGNYRLELPAGEQVLVVSFIGYQQKEVTVNVQAGRTITRNIQLGPKRVEGDEVVIRGQRDILRTLETKLRSTAIIDVIDLGTVQELPIQNMTEALDQLPGINIQGQSAGRGFRNSFVVVRGIQPNLNRVTLMGSPLVSTTADRAVALDVLPSNMASQLEVVKALTPDMDANSIGGTVNLVPMSAFDRPGTYLSASVKTGFVNEEGGLEGDTQPFDLSILGSTRPSEKFGIAAAVNYSQEEFSRTTSQPDNWEPIPEPEFPEDLLVPEGTRLEQSQSSFQRISGTLSADWRPTAYSQFRLIGSHTESEDVQLSTQTEWNYADGKQNIDFDYISDTQIYSPEGENEKEMDIDDQQERLSFLLGQAEFIMGDLTWSVNGSFSRAETNEYVREWSFDSPNFESIIDMTGTVPFATPVDQAAFDDPSSYTFAEIDLEPRDQVSHSYQASTDLQYDTDYLGSGGFLKIGGLYRSEDTFSDFTERQMEYNPAAGFSDISLAGLGLAINQPDVFGRQVSPMIDPYDGPDFIENNPDFLEENVAATLSDRIEDDYEVDENVAAGYVMATANAGDLSVTTGVRIEHTKTTSTVQTFDENNEQFGEETFEKSYTDVLPNLHLRYRFSEIFQVRGALTFTISRPGFSALAGTRSIGYDNSDIVEGTPANPTLVSSADLSQGNPELDPFESTNLDITFEYFRRRGSFYSAGVFFKNIRNPIFEQSINQESVTIGGTEYQQLEVNQPLNAETGTLFGLEAQVQETFTFMPGILESLGITANVVYLQSDFTIPGREGEDLPFFRQPDLILAITPFWQYGGFEARMAYQYTDEFVNSFGSEPLEDEFVDKRGVFDLQFSYDFLQRYSVNVGIKNLTNEPVQRSYQGRSFRVTNLDVEGSQYWFGVRMDI